jgi:hypothetical protein
MLGTQDAWVCSEKLIAYPNFFLVSFLLPVAISYIVLGIGGIGTIASCS